MTSVTHVFNQYYWDLLKKIKDIARIQKHNAENDQHARTILKAIKKSYMSFDKTSDEHLQWYREHFANAWNELAKDKNTLSDWDKWAANAELQDNELYKGIQFQLISMCFKKNDLVLYYLLLLSIFANPEVTSDNVSSLLDALKNRTNGDGVTEIASVQRALSLLYEIVNTPDSTSAKAAAANAPELLMGELENTSLGKLAKEILDEVNVQEIQNSIGDDGDIMKAFADPNGGLSKLIGTVSQKMISKLASGELKQDTLLNDAMKLAGSLGGSSGGALGNMSSMFENFGKMFGGANPNDVDGVDLSAMMKMMMPNMNNKSRGGTSTRATVNSAALTRNVRAKQMRRKLEERRKAKENMEPQVGDDE